MPEGPTIRDQIVGDIVALRRIAAMIVNGRKPVDRHAKDLAVAADHIDELARLLDGFQRQIGGLAANLHAVQEALLDGRAAHEELAAGVKASPVGRPTAGQAEAILKAWDAVWVAYQGRP